jgi:hypothetical protein
MDDDQNIQMLQKIITEKDRRITHLEMVIGLHEATKYNLRDACKQYRKERDEARQWALWYKNKFEFLETVRLAQANMIRRLRKIE